MGVLGRMYEGQNCSAARALELVGERWSLLILRDAIFRGMTRFSEFQRSLGLAPNVLSTRLQGFLQAGLMELDASHGAEPARYRLTDSGRDLAPVIVALTQWGDRWATTGEPPILFAHADCPGPVEAAAVCRECAAELSSGEIEARRGPGAMTA